MRDDPELFGSSLSAFRAGSGLRGGVQRMPTRERAQGLLHISSSLATSS